MKYIVIFLFITSSCVFSQVKTNLPLPQLSTDDFVSSVLVPATVLLYTQDNDGGMTFHCTASAYEATTSGYDFVSAAHCVETGDEDEDDARSKMFFITTDDTAAKQFLKATVKYIGNRQAGDDFSVLQVDTKVDFPIIPLGSDVIHNTGEPVVNVASPMGLGVQLFQGFISLPQMHRPIKVDDGTTWNGAMLLQIVGTNGGSSGSPVICMHQRAICGFVIGIIGGNNSVAVPISRFKNFITESKAGKYKKSNKDDKDK